MSNIKRRAKWNKHGVSEIIGNILILGITVTLFSSIMWFVTAMPTPQEHAYADMTSELISDYDPATGGLAEISVSHKGGQELENSATGIYIWINDTTLLRYKINASTPSIGDSWTAGEVWQITLGSSVFPVGSDPRGAKISLMVVDTVKNSEVYTVVLSGGESDSNPTPPIIGARGTTPSPTYEGDSFSFYASVIDPNDDLLKNSVYIDLSKIFPSLTPQQMLDTNNDGVFTYQSTSTALGIWSGSIVIVNATDAAGNTVIGRITLSILYRGNTPGGDQYIGPFINYSSYFVNGTYPPDVSGGESGGSGGVAGTTFYYIRSLPSMEITKDFSANERAIIEVYSDALKNLALENTFILYHPLTGNPLYPPTSTTAFSYGGIYGTFHRYIYNFTVPSNGLVYPIQMKFKDNYGTVINIVDQINVGGASYPELHTYKYNSTTGSYIETKNFNHTERVYLSIVTKDVDPILSTVYMGTLEISDYTGRYIIKSTPPSSPAGVTTYQAPLSSVFKTDGTSPTRLSDADVSANARYTLYFEPKDAYQGWWLPRTNSYTMKVTMLSDMGPTTGEIYYSLTTQFNLTAPLTTTDIVASIGSGSYTWSSTGASWTNSKLAWYSSTERSDQWQKTTIDDPTYSGPLEMILMDVNNDGYDDVVVGYQDASVSIAYYLNEQTDGTQWSETPILICSAFDALAGRQTSQSSNRGTVNEDASIYVYVDSWLGDYDEFVPTYNNKNYWLEKELVGSMAGGDFDGDGDMDLAASFLHVVTYTTATSPGSANFDNSRPMFFNRGINVFWNDGSWTKTQLYSTNVYTNENNNPAAMDLDVADFNQDGYDDIVAVYEDGNTKVWFSRYLESTGDRRVGAFGTSSSLITLQPTVAGTSPWRYFHVSTSAWGTNFANPKVVAEQVGYGGYPDIVRTSTADNRVSVFYTSSSTDSQVVAYPLAQSGYGRTSDSIANLTVNDTMWENITEVYKEYPLDVAKPTALSFNDNTVQTTDDLWFLWYDDGTTYQVDASPFNTMHISAFGVNSSYNTKLVSSAWLKVKYISDSNYLGTEAFKISTDGIWFTDTNITPTSNQNGVVAWYDLLNVGGVNTYSKLASLDITFVNNGAPPGSIRIDYLWIEIKFIETREVDWTWEVDNTVSMPLHELTVVGNVAAPGESFRLMYSPDNANWFNLTTISSATMTTWIFSLDHTTNSKYYIRIVDLDRTGSELPAGDKANSTVCLNLIKMRNYAPSVTWLISDSVPISPISGLGSAPSDERVTSIAVGDLGKMSGDHKPDGWVDIVVSTTRVGGGDETHSIYILAQTGDRTFSPVTVTTHNMAAVFTSNAIYDVMQVCLGDLDGDYDLDIVVVVGFAPGEKESSPPSTLWIVENDPLPGAWQFDDRSVNVLGATEAAINAVTGNVDLAIFLPFLGVVGILAAEAVSRRKK